MIYLKSDEEVELIRESSLLVAATLAETAKWIAPGVTTNKLDQNCGNFYKGPQCGTGI